MKQKINHITYNLDRKSVTIHFVKKYKSIGLGPLQIARYLIKWSYSGLRYVEKE